MIVHIANKQNIILIPNVQIKPINIHKYINTKKPFSDIIPLQNKLIRVEDKQLLFIAMPPMDLDRILLVHGRIYI